MDVIIPAEQSCTGISRVKRIGVDACVAGIVDALNSHGIRMEFAWNSHLKMGRKTMRATRKRRLVWAIVILAVMTGDAVSGATRSRSSRQKVTNEAVIETDTGKLEIVAEPAIIYISARRSQEFGVINRDYYLIGTTYRENGKEQLRVGGVYNVGGKPMTLRYSVLGGRSVKMIPQSGGEPSFVFHAPGVAIINVVFAGKSAKVMVKVVQLKVKEGMSQEQVIKSLGFPNEKKHYRVSWPESKFINGIAYCPSASMGSLSGFHWRYKKYPGAVLDMSSGIGVPSLNVVGSMSTSSQP